MAEPIDNKLYQPELFDPSTARPPKTSQGNSVDMISLDIKKKADIGLDPMKFAQGHVAKQQFAQSILGSDNKVSTYNYNTNLQDAYTKLNSGTYISKFESFLPGVDNEQRLALQQGSAEKWSNGLVKFGGKTLTAALGGTIGVVDGLIQGISEGSLSAAYDSDFNNWLDDLNTKMDYKLPNYYTQQEKNQGFFSSMGTANFWANDVLGALSFTTGAIVSEGLWAAATGGTSILGKGILSTTGRALAKQSALNTVKAEVKGVLNQTAKKGLKDYARSVTRSGKTIEGLNTTRFLITSAGYEAGVEARHYMKDTREQWEQNFQQTMGRTPTAQEAAEFNDRLTDTANGVFGVNMALVGASNLATIGRLALGRPVSSKIENSVAKKFLFGVGYEKTAAGTYKALEATKFQRTFGRIYSAGKMGFVEGVFEEGGQGVASSSAEEFMLNGYDINGTRTSLDVADAFIQGIKNTYGTKEGFKEVGIGIIVGLLGGGLNQATTGQGLFGEVEADRKNIETFVDIRNEFTNDLVAEQLVERFKANNKIQNAVGKREKAEAMGDVTGITMSDQELMLASIERDHKFQGTEQGIDDFTSALATIPNEQIAKEAGIDLAETEAWKEQKISEYTKMSTEYSENIEFAKALVGNLPIIEANDPKVRTEIERAIAFNLSMGAQANELAKTYVEEIKSNIASEILGNDISRAMDVQETLRKTEPRTRAELAKLTNDKNTLLQQRDRIKNELVGLQYETTSPNQDATQRTNRQKEVQDRLVAVEQRIQEVSQQQQLILDTINVADLEADVTLDELDNQQGSLEKLKRTVETIKNVSPQRHALLTNLFREYEKAIGYARKYDSTTRKITDPKTSINEISGWASKLVSKLKKADSDSMKFFADIVEQYEVNEQRIRTEANNIEQRQSGEVERTEWEIFVASGEVSPERLGSIAQKISNGEELSPREQDMRQANAPQVETILKNKREGVDPPTTTPKERNRTITIKTRPKSETEDSRILSGVKAIAAEKTIEHIVNDGISKGQSFEEIRDRIYNKYVFSQYSEDVISFIKGKIDGSIKEDFSSFRKPVTETKQQTPSAKNSVESIERQINQVLNGRYAAIYNGDDAAELTKQEPSKKDLKEYNDLLNKINPSQLNGITFRPYNQDSGLTQEEFTRFMELNTKLNDWKTLQGSLIGESDSLAGLLQLLRKKQQQFQKKEVNPDITERNFAEIATAPENRPEKEASESISTIQSPNQVLFAHEQGTRKYRISHMNISSLAALVPNSTLYKVDKNGVEKIDDGQDWKQKGNIYVIRAGEEKLRVEVGDRSRLLVDISSFDSFPKNIKLLTFRNGKATYYSAYTQKEGKWVPIEGDFVYGSIIESEQIDYNPERTYDLQDGQVLRTEVNKNDVYNAQLLEEYRQAEDKKQAKEDLIRNLNIYVMPQGSTKEVIGSLRSISNTKQPMTESLSNLYNLRKQAVEKALKSKAARVDLGRTVQVRFTLTGNPNIQVQEDANGNLVPLNSEFTDEMIGQIEDIGYVQDGKIKTQKNLQLEDRNTIFARAMKGQGKTPIIVFRYRGMLQAFPIALKKSTVDKSARAKDILSQTLPASQKIMQLEDELINNNLDPRIYDLDPNYEAEVNGILVGWENSPGVTKALQDLSSIEEFEDVERFLDPSYDKANLKNVALTPLDITNRPFSAGKPIINLDNIGYTGREEQLREERAYTEGELEAMENVLSNYAIQLQNNLLAQENVGQYQDIENQYTDVFAEDEVYKKPESWTERMHNINMLRQALKHISKSKVIRENIGEQNIETMKQDLKEFDRANKERTVISNTLKNQIKNAKICQ